MPTFSGDKTKFEYFWTAFESIVDDSDEPAKYKMIRLKACLQGKAEESISKLGFSEEAYEEAKKTLKRRFGGERRQLQNYLEEVKRIKSIQEGNVHELEKFADTLASTVVTLREHGRWSELDPGSLLYTVVLEKIPKSMLSRFYRWVKESGRLESIETLRDWITEESEYQVKAVETVEGLHGAKGKPKEDDRKRWNRTFTTFKQKCYICQGNHTIRNCEEYKSMSVDDRWKIAKEKKLCFRCLANNHQGRDCKRSKECGINGCKRNHDRLLHQFQEIQAHEETVVEESSNSSLPSTRAFATVASDEPALPNAEQSIEEHSHLTTLASAQNQESASLRTVPIWLSANGKKIKVNALLDDASSVSYVNEELAGALGLSATYEQVTVNVLNESVETFDSMPVSMTLESCDGNVRIPFKALTCPRRVTGNYKSVVWSKFQDRWPHLRVCKFPEPPADPIVDVLIGQDQIDLHYSKCDVRGNPGEPIARLGPLGWSCVGPPQGRAVIRSHRTNLACTFFTRPHIFDEINDSLKRFWEIDTLGIQEDDVKILSGEEKLALDKTRLSLTHDGERYQVATPWKTDWPTLPNNYEMAYSRLRNTEKRLIRQSSVGEDYQRVITSYIDKGYIRKVHQTENEPENPWYLPHFPVCRPERSTTKTRIVFDASAKFQGTSLNDHILPGPKLQTNLFDVLLRFRRFPVAIACDVSEMYLQIRIPPEDRPKFRFLWRNLEVDRDPDVYEFERVVFGDASAPFRAQFVSQENARIHEEKFPLAAETVMKSTYMDDSLDSTRDNVSAVQLFHQLQGLWDKAGMKARKWLSNSPEVLTVIPQELRAFEIDLNYNALPLTKTLGVLWSAQEDVFSFHVATPVVEDVLTKRSILGRVAAVFDPLGLASPFIVRAKILIQDLWSMGLGWDEPITREISVRVKEWFSELEELKEIKVPRSLREPNVEKSSSVHTFVDASKDAYGAVSYLRCEYDQGCFGVSIIASKTKVAPLKPMTTPRLELMAAILGLNLTTSIVRALNIPIADAHFWSDSMDVLYWIRGRGRQFRPFVANRIGEIQRQSSPEQWQYVESKENPADLCSRGLSAHSLMESQLWWNGPQFLLKAENDWPRTKIEEGSEVKKEARKTFLILQQQCFVSIPISKDPTWKLNPVNWSSWTRLTRVSCWVVRFITNCRARREDRTVGPLTPEEIQNIEVQVIRAAQREDFAEEFSAIQANRALPKKSRLLKLTPKVDPDGLLRADGRLQYAENLPYDVRFPVILPRGNWVTKLIVKHYHEAGHHITGTNHTLANLSTKYWIVAAREEIRDWEKSCNECRRRKLKAADQIMAPLPDVRIRQPLRAFAHVSVDYGGPFITVQGRGKRRQKRWLCLFTCLSSRAVHLEMAYGLDTDSFLRCFVRMTSRRGYPLTIVSDRGTNFIGADRELRELVDGLDQNRIQDQTVDKGVKWSFNPPLAPHFGGVHEVMIKAAKKAIRAILRNADVNDEELTTAFVGVEALMNSRPLTYQSADPRDATPLTPNHFLHGQMGGVSAPESVDEVEFSPRNRWRRVQELISHFWKRWMKEWLPLLNARQKWTEIKPDLKIGDIVLAISPDCPRAHWPLGRVLEVFPGQDGHVRVAKIQIGQNTVLRPVSKCVLLDSN